MLSRGSASVAAIAEHVGYGSRLSAGAFKKLDGAPPATWRRQRQQTAPTDRCRNAVILCADARQQRTLGIRGAGDRPADDEAEHEADELPRKCGHSGGFGRVRTGSPAADRASSPNAVATANISSSASRPVKG